MTKLREREYTEIQGRGFRRGRLKELYIDFENYKTVKVRRVKEKIAVRW
jgi:hypothetical protein